MRECVRESLDSLDFQFVSHNLHRNAQSFELRERGASLVEIAGERDFGNAVIAECVQRGGRDGVDGFGTDQVVNVDGVGIGGIFRARGSPQRTLHAGAAQFERLPAACGENGRKRFIGKLGVGDGGLAAQGRALGKFRVNLGINTRDEERGHRCNVVNWVSRGEPVFEAVEVGHHHVGIAHQRKDEGYVDVDAGRDGAPDRRNTGFCGGNLDHQVWPGDARPKLLCLRGRGFGVVGEIRTDFDAHKAVAAIRLLVKRQERVAGILDIFDGKLPEDLLRVPARPGQRHKRGIIIRGLGDGVVENGRVGGDAANVAAFDHGFEFAALRVQQFALDIVVPEGLAEGGEGLDGVHGLVG